MSKHAVGGPPTRSPKSALALPLRTIAPAKINLGLFVGPIRPDGRHELVSVMQPISLADELLLEDAPGASADEVLCPGVQGENLAARALAAFRTATGWSHGPVRLSIAKRTPLAAGLGGGSADAGAALRLLCAASGFDDRSRLAALALGLGADVPAQLAPARVLAGGVGERLRPLPEPGRALGVLVLAQRHGLSTGAVYATADALGGIRTAAELERLAERLAIAYAAGEALPPDAPELLDNDLQPACLAASEEAGEALAQARFAGADVALVSGSGPTVLGLFAGADGPARARRAAELLAERRPAAVAAETVGASFALVAPPLR